MAHIQVYQGGDAQWYWRLVADNGQIVAVGGEGYVAEYTARRAAERTREISATARIVNAKMQPYPQIGAATGILVDPDPF